MNIHLHIVLFSELNKKKYESTFQSDVLALKTNFETMNFNLFSEIYIRETQTGRDK